MNSTAFSKDKPAQGEFFPSASFDFSPFPSLPDKTLSPGTIGELAVKALLEEVYTTPKPGLVDMENTGAHTDMDYRTFLSSAVVLRGCFSQCAQAGMVFPDNLPVLAVTLRRIGLDGERSMYGATGGANTHKGAIFSMGILCAAASMKFGTLKELQEHCSHIADALLEDDRACGTHGLAVREANGTGGIRKEALSGFDTAFSAGLPALDQALEAGSTWNDAMVYTLLCIIAAAEDSNLVHRGGAEGNDFAKKEATQLTAGGPEKLDLEEVRRLDGEFIKRNLSPGGSADLLAFSAMLYFLRKEAIYD